MAAEIIPISKAKQRLLELAREVDEGGKRFVLVRDGVPVSVLVPVEEYEAWQETLEVLEDRETMASLRRGLKDAGAGRVYQRTARGSFVPARRRPKVPKGPRRAR
jgi:prevent-host-death family protein